MLEKIKESLHMPEYDFLRNNKHLNENICLIALGGSYAYGTNNENSDIDIRGIALNSKSDILLGADFEQIRDDNTDTVIYSLNKMLKLLADNNPNTIEILGCLPEHYLYVSSEAQQILDNKHIFLSKRVIHTFGGYANQMLYRATQRSTKTMNQTELEEHILKTLQCMQTDFAGKYTDVPTDSIKLYIDKAVQEDFDTEIFMDVNLTKYPLRDYCSLWGELQNTVRQYGKIGKRNEHALSHNKIGKHLMHLVRTYYMCLDILEREEVVTYRAAEHDLLMDIRNNKFVTEDNQIRSEFFDLVNELEKRLDYAKENTSLPDIPDFVRINELKMQINEQIVKKS